MTGMARTVRGMLDELEIGRGGQRHDASASSTPTHVTGQVGCVPVCNMHASNCWRQTPAALMQVVLFAIAWLETGDALSATVPPVVFWPNDMTLMQAALIHYTGLAM